MIEPSPVLGSFPHQGVAFESEAGWKGKGAGTAVQVQDRVIARAVPISLDEDDALGKESDVE